MNFRPFRLGESFFLLVTLIGGFIIGFGIGYLTFHTKISGLVFFEAEMPKATVSKDLSDTKEVKSTSNLSHYDLVHKGEDTAVARILYEKVRVLCMVMTSPANDRKRAIFARATWGKRCNKFILMSTMTDKELENITLENVQKKEGNLWNRTREVFKHVYKHYYDRYDWFIEASDNTFVIVENLRYMLQPIDPLQPVYFESKFNPLQTQGFKIEGPGYILSREALRRFIEESETKCQLYHREVDVSVDVEMRKCMENLGVTAGENLDIEERHCLLPYGSEELVMSGHTKDNLWYWKYIYYVKELGKKWCSDTAVSFHHLKPNIMQLMEYLVYHLRAFGITKGSLRPVIDHHQRQTAPNSA